MKEVTNNQLFEYMTMMYGEMTEMKGDLKDFKQKSAVFEEKTDQRLKALFDGYEAHTEAIAGLTHEVSDLKKIVSNHEVKLKIIK